MREGYGACRKAVRSEAQHRSERVVRSSPTRSAARDTPNKITKKNLFLFQ
ncbi:MAG: hypothetical protein NZ455_06570 [Bacteroidia bacterium]|nr:hypothetical protein [Bacteroidia bacterium]MDW8345699.1 hypothetical protein [Bacteroidia bacterium]